MKVEMNTFFPDDSVRTDCELIHRGGELIVSYDDTDEADRPLKVIYKGKAVRPGQWLLVAPEVKGRASLSLSVLDPCFLEGRWIEGSRFGMWTIEADDDLKVLLRIAAKEE